MENYFVKLCPIFDSSASKSVTTYQKILQVCSLKCKNLLIFTCTTKQVHNRHHTNLYSLRHFLSFSKLICFLTAAFCCNLKDEALFFHYISDAVPSSTTYVAFSNANPIFGANPCTTFCVRCRKTVQTLVSVQETSPPLAWIFGGVLCMLG